MEAQEEQRVIFLRAVLVVEEAVLMVYFEALRLTQDVEEEVVEEKEHFLSPQIRGASRESE